MELLGQHQFSISYHRHEIKKLVTKNLEWISDIATV